MRAAEVGDPGQMSLRGDDDPRGALDPGLDDHGGDLSAALVEQTLQGPDAGEAASALRRAEPAAPGMGVGEPQRLEHGRLVGLAEGSLPSQRGGAEGVAVVGHLHHREAAALGPAGVDPVLERHLEGRLDGAGAVGAVEEAGKPPGDVGGEPLRQLEGGGVGGAEEGAVLQPLRLAPDRLDDVRVPVAVDDRPDRGHAVDVLAAVPVDDAVALGAVDDQPRLAVVAGHRREGVPDAGRRPRGHASSTSNPMSSIIRRASLVPCPGVVR